MSPIDSVVKDLRLEDNDKDLQMQTEPRGQGLSSRTVNKTKGVNYTNSERAIPI